MRIAVIVSLLLVGFAAGWFARELTQDEPRQRVPRAQADRRDRPRFGITARGQGEVVEPGPLEPTPPEPGPAASPEPEEPPSDRTETGEQEDPIAKWVRAQSVQWKAWASMQAGQRIEGLLKDLGFDEETARLIEEAIAEEAERQTERAIRMFLGEEEIDASAFGYFMGLPPELSPELERELSTFLSDGEIASLRDGFKRTYDKQVRSMADMQINMMGIADMTADQHERMRKIFTAKDVFKEQMTQFASVTRDREKLRDLVQGKGLAEAMERNFAPTRDRVRDILTPAQFERYRAYEQTIIRQAEMGMKMFAGMLEQVGPPK